jgi:outer membrane protein assembly factor BamB
VVLLLPVLGLAGNSSDALTSAVKPPEVTVLQNIPGQADGLVFIAPKAAGIGGGPQPGPVGPEIVDGSGRVIWFSPVTNGQVAADFRVQSYRGKPVLTWAQMSNFGKLAGPTSVNYIADDTYHIIATVKGGNGLNADAHEFLLTPQGTALITIYDVAPADLSSVGGSKDAQVWEGSIQEIDVSTGKVIFEWHSLGKVGFDESYWPMPDSSTSAWDYIHINGLAIDDDGNLLLSARHTSTVYKLDRRTGEVIWRLGGKKSDFHFGTDAGFSFQHNAIASGHNTIRIFDNEVNPKPVLPWSRVIWLKLDPSTKTATLIRSINHPDHLSVLSQGSAQLLDNGNTFVGWGETAHFSEFDSNGRMIFDATLPKGYDTYRAYRFRWPPDRR